VGMKKSFGGGYDNIFRDENIFSGDKRILSEDE
jgi:hypothetical protein